MKWNGMRERKRNGMEWNGMEWNGMECANGSGMEWNGMEWNARTEAECIILYI